MTQRLYSLISIKNYSWADIHLFWVYYDGLAYFPATCPATCHLSLVLDAPAPFISSWRLPHDTLLDLSFHLQPLTGMENPILSLLPSYWMIRSLPTEQVSLVNGFSREGARFEKKKAIGQHCNMTWVYSKAEGRFIFFAVCFYIILSTYK